MGIQFEWCRKDERYEKAPHSTPATMRISFGLNGCAESAGPFVVCARCYTVPQARSPLVRIRADMWTWRLLPRVHSEPVPRRPHGRKTVLAAADFGMANGLMPCMPSSVASTFWISLPPTSPAWPGKCECRKATLARTEKRRALWRNTEKCEYP